MIYQSWCVLCIDKTINTDENESKVIEQGKKLQMVAKLYK